MDAIGEGLFFKGLKEFYQNPDAKPASTEIGFRNYAMVLHSLYEHETICKSRTYWWEQIPKLHPPISLPYAKSPEMLEEYQYTARYKIIAPDAWMLYKKRASKAALTPAGFLCAAFAEFTFNAMAYNRFVPNSEINQVMGNMSSTLFVAADGSDSSGESFEKRAGHIQKQLLEGFQHRYISSVQVLNELYETKNRFNKGKQEKEPVLMPVMFDSLLGIHPGSSNYDWIGEMTCQTVERPPEVLDCQVFENSDGALIIKWDTVDEAFLEGVPETMLQNYVSLLDRLLEAMNP
jgi:hypothetical protein